ncbi:MAG: hypothetical protein HQL99_09930 [Magnetococcales bacterium]|nr:hypothetical protein [Magnetococcales bacterium]
MPLYINTNIASLNSQRNLLGSTGELNKVFARLSSGLRINTAGDDAAGLAISNRMTSQIRGLTQAVRNANDGISVSQVAEGALAEHSNMLQRMNELAVQAANATNSDADRLSLQQEINQLLGELERVAQETEFNNWPMLNGETQPLVFHVGAREDQTVTVTLADARAETLLSQTQLANPNAAESVFNSKIKGMVIKAPNPALSNSKLFSSNVAVGINAIANADSSKSSPWTTDPTKVADSMIEAFEGNIAALTAADTAVSGASSPGDSDVANKLGALSTTSTTIKADAYKAAVKAANGGSEDTTVETALTALSLTGGESVETVAATITTANSGISSAQAKVAAAAVIAASRPGASVVDARNAAAAQTIRNADSSLSLDKAQVIAAAAYKAAETSTRSAVVTAITNSDGTVSGLTTAGVAATHVHANDQAAVVSAITTGISNGDTADEIALAAVRADAGSSLTLDEAKVIVAAAKNVNSGGTATSAGVAASAVATKDAVVNAISTSTSTSVVLENAVNASGVKDVPVGNILEVVNAFRAAISQGADIETAAAAARKADAGKNLSIDIAKVIAAGGKAASNLGSTVSQANTAADNMARVLDSRDFAVSYAAKFGAKPAADEHLVVPEWLIDTSGSNSFPPSPLVDITGASVPTDPTLPFNPPTTNATNPPLNGAKAAGQMLAIIAGAIDRVSSTRAELGAIQNRFEANIANLSNVVENVSAARSRILDADIAAETANLTKLSIMQQAGTAILAQANQQPQLALQLLR